MSVKFALNHETKKLRGHHLSIGCNKILQIMENYVVVSVTSSSEFPQINLSIQV